MKRYIIWIFCMGFFLSCEKKQEELVIEVEKLLFKTSEIELSVGEKRQILSEFTPKDATDTVVIWNSEKPEIATVDGKGIVTGLKAGETKISGNLGKGYAELSVKVNPVKAKAKGLLLSKSEWTMIEGEKYVLTAEIYPESIESGEIVWSSSNEEVASVVNGEITAIRKGEAEIKAKLGTIESICRLSVLKKIVPATGLSFEKEKIEIKVEETVDVKVKIEPDDATEREVHWSISDTDIATVIEGKVSGKFAGETTLKAWINDTVYAEIPVRVIQPATSIRFYDTYLEIGEGGTYTINPIIEPYNTTDKTVIWSSSNEEVARVENGKITALIPGETTITGRCGDVSATCEVKVTKEEGNPITIPDEKFLNKLLQDHDENKNGRLTDYEAAKVAKINIWWEGVKSLKGIEYFINLRELNATRNELTKVDLSANKELEELKIGENPLTELNLKANSKLLLLEINKIENLTDIDLTNNKELSRLDASGSGKFILGDISKNTELISLMINGTNTKKINLASNSKLETLYCGGNEEFTIEGLEMLTNLRTFYLYDASAMEELDFSHMKKLNDINIRGNHKLKKIILSADYSGDIYVPEGIEIVRK